MAQRTVLIVLGIIVILGGGYFVMNSLRSNGPISVASAASVWVEVTSPHVSLSDNTGAVLRELNTGDELKQGDTIISGAGAAAIIHLPDGSTFRIEENSKLTLDKAEFGAQDETTSVQATLSMGRVWSKVVSLVTPQSEWQVRTSNAVATVRGTSFGVEYKDNKSRVLVSEHKVKVGIFDPKTKKLIPQAERDVDEGKQIEIKNEDVPALALAKIAAPEPVSISSLPSDVRDWTSRNKAADKDIDDKITAIKKEGLGDKEVRTILREETKSLEIKVKELRVKKEENEEINKEIRKTDAEEFRVRLKTHVMQLRQDADRGKSGDEKSEEIVNPRGTTTEVGNPVKLEIVGVTNQKLVTDGEKVKVRAFVVFANGAKKDITAKVDWSVTGDIGGVKDGVFSAKIPAQDSELPEIKGTIQATYRDGDISLTSDPVNVTVVPQDVYTVPVG